MKRRYDQLVDLAYNPRVFGYIVGVMLFLVVLFLKLRVRALGLSSPWLLFSGACAVAAWYGGVRPALLTAALSVLASVVLFLPARDSTNWTDATIASAVFIAQTIIVATLLERQAEALSRERAVTQRLRDFSELTSDGIVVANATGHILYVNASAEDLFGYDARTLIGQPLALLMTSGQAAAHMRAFERYEQTRKRTVDWKCIATTGRHRDGSDIPLEMSLLDYGYKDMVLVGIMREVEGEVDE